MKAFLTLFFTLFIAFSANIALALEGAELQRVNLLLDLFATNTDLIMVRNGAQYPVERAITHLRNKLSSSPVEINTAEEFIDLLASKSSVTGKPYTIIFPNGRNIHSSLYFHELLQQVDSEIAQK
ncbi:MAG: DUF5329 family protein [Deltaproteobacteria bacterium]|jgi:hypothetical protein|nr:DUF5329 family protein [Deltaproteobacteria bacterium]